MEKNLILGFIILGVLAASSCMLIPIIILGSKNRKLKEQVEKAKYKVYLTEFKDMIWELYTEMKVLSDFDLQLINWRTIGIRFFENRSIVPWRSENLSIFYGKLDLEHRRKAEELKLEIIGWFFGDLPEEEFIGNKNSNELFKKIKLINDERLIQENFQLFYAEIVMKLFEKTNDLLIRIRCLN